MDSNPTPETVEINGKKYKTDTVLMFTLEQLIEKNIFDDFRNCNYKHICIEFEELPGKKVILSQDFRLDKGGIFWDGSYLIARYLMGIEKPAKNLKPEKPLKILELGGATSLPSIALAHAGHDVITTDLEKILPLMEENVYQNIPKGKNIEAKLLRWGNEEHMKAIEGPFNYILCAELVYNTSVFDDLVNTLKYYCNEKTKVILCFRFRLQEKLDTFYEIFNKEFDYEQVGQDEIKKYLPNPGFLILVGTKKKQQESK